jgi:hypothetical protein
MSRKFCFALGLGLLAVALCASTAQAQRRGGFFGRSQSLVGLASNETVQKEIGLTDTSKVEKLNDDYRTALGEEMQAAGIDFGGLRDLPEAERNAKMRELTAKSEAAAKKVNDKFEPMLKDALTAEQFKRVSEIKMQADGAAALGSDAVAKELGLSDDQKKKLAGILEEADKARRELFAGAQGNFQERAAKGRELDQQTLTKATDVLDAGQKEKFTALKGKPFDVSQLRGRGRRGNNN